MTIPSTARKAGPLLGTGVQTTWPFTFKVFAPTDIAVTTAILGVETQLVYGSDYSVALNPNQETSPGGTVTYPISGTPLPTGGKLTIIGNLPYDQPLDLPSGGNFSPLALENQLDRTTMQIQQLGEQVGRALRLPVTSTGANTVLPIPESNNLIGWNEAATGLQNFDPLTLATVVAFASARADQFTGNGVQTAFTLTANPGTQASLDVAVGGVTQLNGVDFTWNGGTTVTFTSAPPIGASVQIRYALGLPQGYTDSANSLFLQSGTGAATRFVQDKLREVVSVKDFGAKGDGVTDDTAAIIAAQAAVVAQGGGALYYPTGVYVVSGGIEMAGGVKHMGSGRPESNFNTAHGSKIVSSNGPIFKNAATLITGANFENLWLESKAGGGHIFDWSLAGIVAKVEISHCVLLQKNANRAVVQGTAAGGVFSIWMHDFEYLYQPGATVSPINIRAFTVNSFTIERFWSTCQVQAASAPSVVFESTNPGGQAFNVLVRQGVFEYSVGGSVRLLSCANSSIEDCTVYDISIPITDHQFYIGKGATGPSSYCCNVRRCRSFVGNATYADLYIDVTQPGQSNFVVDCCTFFYADAGSASPGPQIVMLNTTVNNYQNMCYLDLGNGGTNQVGFKSTAGTSKNYALWAGYPGNSDGSFNFSQNGAYLGGIGSSGYFQWGGTATVPKIYMTPVGSLYASAQIFPGTPLGADQSACGLYAGSGAPPAGGNNGDIYFRGDGGAGTTIYQKRAGVWVGIV